MMKTENLYKTKSECCGCSMCATMCPTGIIEMREDQDGFLYPEIFNENKCLNCSKCLNVCPIKTSTNVQTEFIDYYAGSFSNDAETISCASGGLATAISNRFIEENGVVYGVAYSNNWKNAEYIRADSFEQIERLKTSKYIQAYKGNIYKTLEIDLKNNKKCLFIGLPCDVAAVKDSFMKYDNLFTIELICHGPTSQLVHKQYCEESERKAGSKISGFSSRFKKDGKWIPFYINVHMENGMNKMEPFHSSSYGAAFRYLKRPSCYSCPIKGNALKGDLMIGDYHYVEKGMKGYNPHGVSSAIVHNSKGLSLLKCLNDKFELVHIKKRNALANGAIHRPIESPYGQENFQRVFESKGLTTASRLTIVRKSNFTRNLKSVFLFCAVRIKRIIKPSSRPTE